jgi:DNA-binding CsgD family transcriptional regulator
MQQTDFDEFYSTLTMREKKILPLVVDGLTSGEISRLFNCEESTIKKHREHILQKAHVKGITAIRQFLTAIKPFLP